MYNQQLCYSNDGDYLIACLAKSLYVYKKKKLLSIVNCDKLINCVSIISLKISELKSIVTNPINDIINDDDNANLICVGTKQGINLGYIANDITRMNVLSIELDFVFRVYFINAHELFIVKLASSKTTFVIHYDLSNRKATTLFCSQHNISFVAFTKYSMAIIIDKIVKDQWKKKFWVGKASTNNYEILIINKEGKQVCIKANNILDITSLAINSTATELAIGGRSGTIHWIDISTLLFFDYKTTYDILNLNILYKHWHSSSILSLAYSYDDTITFSAGSEGVICTWENKNYALNTKLSCNILPVLELIVSPKKLYEFAVLTCNLELYIGNIKKINIKLLKQGLILPVVSTNAIAKILNDNKKNITTKTNEDNFSYIINTYTSVYKIISRHFNQSLYLCSEIIVDKNNKDFAHTGKLTLYSLTESQKVGEVKLWNVYDWIPDNKAYSSYKNLIDFYYNNINNQVVTLETQKSYNIIRSWVKIYNLVSIKNNKYNANLLYSKESSITNFICICLVDNSEIWLGCSNGAIQILSSGKEFNFIRTIKFNLPIVQLIDVQNFVICKTTKSIIIVNKEKFESTTMIISDKYHNIIVTNYDKNYEYNDSITSIHIYYVTDAIIIMKFNNIVYEYDLIENQLRGTKQIQDNISYLTKSNGNYRYSLLNECKIIENQKIIETSSVVVGTFDHYLTDIFNTVY